MNCIPFAYPNGDAHYSKAPVRRGKETGEFIKLTANFSRRQELNFEIVGMTLGPKEKLVIIRYREIGSKVAETREITWNIDDKVRTFKGDISGDISAPDLDFNQKPGVCTFSNARSLCKELGSNCDRQACTDKVDGREYRIGTVRERDGKNCRPHNGTMYWL